MPFVSFEGIDGCGKTTQLDHLASRLEGEGKIVLRTKEPGGGALGGVVRAIFTREGAPPMSHMEQMLLVNAARFDHVRSVIKPALADGAWVLTDRFYDSTFALQVFETDIPTALFETLRDAVVGEVRPDLTFVLDLPAVSAQERRGGRPSDDPLEQHRDFERIRRGFRAVAASDPTRCRLIDASGSEDMVGAAIRRELWTRFSDSRG